MNNHERQECRRQRERREDDDALAKAMPNINRAHRDCERECLDLKATIDEQEGIIEGQDKSISDLVARIKALESLLAEAGLELHNLTHSLRNRMDSMQKFDIITKEAFELIDKIDAILPATEDNKDAQ